MDGLDDFVVFLAEAVEEGDFLAVGSLLAGQFVNGRRQYSHRVLARQFFLTFCGGRMSVYGTYRKAMKQLKGAGKRAIPSDTTIFRSIREWEPDELEYLLNVIFASMVKVFYGMCKRVGAKPWHVAIFDTVKVGWFGEPPMRSTFIETQEGVTRRSVPNEVLTEAGRQAVYLPPDAIKGTMWGYEYLLLVLRFPELGVTLPIHVSRITDSDRVHADQVQRMLNRLDDFPEPAAVAFDRGFAGRDANAVLDSWGRRHPNVLGVTPGIKHEAKTRARARQKVRPEDRRGLGHVAKRALGELRHELKTLVSGYRFYQVDRNIPGRRVEKEHVNLFFQEKTKSTLRPDLTMSASAKMFVVPFFTSRRITVQEAELLLDFYAMRWAVETAIRDIRQGTLPRNPVRTAYLRDLMFYMAVISYGVYYLAKAYEVLAEDRDPERTRTMEEFSEEMWLECVA